MFRPLVFLSHSWYTISKQLEIISGLQEGLAVTGGITPFSHSSHNRHITIQMRDPSDTSVTTVTTKHPTEYVSLTRNTNLCYTFYERIAAILSQDRINLIPTYYTRSFLARAEHGRGDPYGRPGRGT